MNLNARVQKIRALTKLPLPKHSFLASYHGLFNCASIVYIGNGVTNTSITSAGEANSFGRMIKILRALPHLQAV